SGGSAWATAVLTFSAEGAGASSARTAAASRGIARERTPGTIARNMATPSVCEGLPLLPRLGPAQAELVAGADDRVALEDDLDHLLAVDLAALLVLQGDKDLLRLRIDHLAGGGVGVPAVQAEGHPAGLLAQLDAIGLPGRHDGGVEDVDVAVGAIDHPDLFLVGGEADAVAGAAVALRRPLLEVLHLHAVQ